ncbi:MAG: triosephosphate isomerase TpiA [Phormidium sp. OSCR]|nr:MAG: triosephosphate isomerase TpiA [Phormidium sp. OSCR]
MSPKRFTLKDAFVVSWRKLLSPVRKTVLAGNWKMYKTQAEALEFLKGFVSHLEDTPDERDVILCVPYTALGSLSKNLHGGRVRLGAQNVHWEDCGAFTGEISAPMLTELGVDYVVVGHSERREYFAETDETVNRRLKAAQAAGMTPILCVGETKAQRDAGETEAHIFSQLENGLVDVDQNKLIIAYEPIWAIGTGDTCEAAEANRVIGLIRSKLTNAEVPIQYGGSVKPANVDEIMAQPEIDGALVGGASLEPESFARIVNYKA